MDLATAEGTRAAGKCSLNLCQFGAGRNSRFAFSGPIVGIGDTLLLYLWDRLFKRG